MSFESVNFNDNIFLNGLFSKKENNDSTVSNQYLNSTFGFGFSSMPAMMPLNSMMLPGSVGAMDFNFNDYMNTQMQNLSVMQSLTSFVQNIFGANSPIPANGGAFPGMMQMPNFFGDPKAAFTNFSTEAAAAAEESSERTYSKPSGKGLDKAFLNRVKEVAKNINCDYKDLLAVMNSESGLNSKAYNKCGGATGLIQFMPKTARQLGTTTEALAKMSPIEQLDYVEKFYLQNKKAYIKSNEKLSAGQLYALTFLPARANREVLTTKGEVYYNAGGNYKLDINGDNKITQSELSARVRSKSVDESIFA